MQHAAYTMSDPADLINLAVEHLIQQRFELPAFSTLERRYCEPSLQDLEHVVELVSTEE
jgi:hypothetical protein